MKKSVIAYWTATGLVVAANLMGGIMDLVRPPELVANMAHLGYPAYFLLILGAWKLLAVPALLVPGFARLKEWAYAGIVFDLTGASLSHALVGDPAGKVIAPLVLLAVTAASYALRPASRRVVVPAPAEESRAYGGGALPAR